MMFYQIVGDMVFLQVWVKPGASKNKILGLSEKGLTLSVTAKAQDGEANKAVCQLLADYFDIPKTHVLIHKGIKGRQKMIHLPLSQKTKEKLKCFNENHQI